MADSVSEAVGDAVEAAVVALGLTEPGATPATAVPVSRRKTPSLPEGKAPPEVVISVGAEPATEYVTASRKIRKYPVAVTIVTGGGTRAGDDLAVRAWRDRIDAAVDTRTAFAGLGGFNQVDAGGGAPFDVSALAKDFAYSVQTFTVQVAEELPAPTVYQRLDDGGTVVARALGMAIRAVGASHLAVQAAPLVANDMIPAADDQVRTGDGEWWRVTGAGPLSGGAWVVAVQELDEG